MNLTDVSPQNDALWQRIETLHQRVKTAAELHDLCILPRRDDLATLLCTACHLTAIGAFDVTLGFFDWEQEHYKKIPLREQVEVLSLVGDIALKDG